MTKKQAAALALAVLLLFTGLMIYRSQTVVLRLGVFAGSAWDVPSPKSYEILDQAIARFEQEHPGIRVEYTSGILKEDYSDYLASQMAQGKAPDVFMILPEDFDLLCSVGALAPLDVWMAEDAVTRENLYESALAAGRWQGWQYALPFESNMDLLFVNTTLLQKEGITLPEQLTLEDFYAICEQVTQDTDGDGRMDQFGICDYTWKHAADAFGAQLFSADGSSISLCSPEIKAAMSYTSRLQTLCADARADTDSFSSGKAAFAVMSFADYRTYAPYPWKIKRLSSFDWTAMPLPAQEEGIAEIQTIEMAVSAQSRYPDKSWELLKTLCLDKDIQQMHYTCSQGISALKSAEKTVSEDSEVDYSILEQVMNKPVRQARFSRYASALEMTNREMEQILSSTGSQDVLLMQAEERINRYLNQ